MDTLKHVIKYLALSKGSHIPLVGFGCHLGPTKTVCYESVQRSVESAIDVGYRHFDVAYIYNTEIPLGRALNAKFEAGVIKREDVFVTTKLPWDSHHPDDVREAFQKSLENLGLKYLDLYLIHWPAPVIKNAEGPLTSRPFDEENGYIGVWKILEDLVKEGHIKAIGLSNFNSRQVENVLKHCSIKPVVNQCEVHLYHQNKELIEHNRARDMRVVAFTPLGIGHSSDSNWEFSLKDPVVLDLAQKYSKTPGQIALRFLVQQEVVVIPSSNSPGHQAENLQIFDFEIKEEDLQKLRSLDKKLRQLKIAQLKNHKEYPFNEPF